MSSKLCARDLPSKRLLGKGLASVGYETELKGERFARLDFIGVPSSTFQKEATVVAGLKHHTNVVKAHGWAVNKTSGSLVLEYVEDDLLGLMQKRKESSCSQPFELAEALDIMLQIARGMKFLHEQNILHGDLKTKNILVTCRKEEDRDALFLVKVADYGLVRTKRKSMSFVSRQARKLDVVRWRAPETIVKVLSECTDETSSQSDSNSDDECVGASDSVLLSGDVYSFAITCFQILTGEDPYPILNWEELGLNIVSRELRPELPASSLSGLNVLLEACWSEAPQRPAFPTICIMLEYFLQNLQTPTTREIQPSPSEDAVTLLQESELELGDKGVVSDAEDIGVKYIARRMGQFLCVTPKQRRMRKNSKGTSSSNRVTSLSKITKESSLSAILIKNAREAPSSDGVTNLIKHTRSDSSSSAKSDHSRFSGFSENTAAKSDHSRFSGLSENTSAKSAHSRFSGLSKNTSAKSAQSRFSDLFGTSLEGR